MGESEFDLENIFRYHEPTPKKIAQYQAIRDAAKEFARILLSNSPPGSDQSEALLHIRKAVMIANAAIALDGILYKE